AREKREEESLEKDKGVSSDKVVVEYVFLYIEGKAELRKVTTGIQNNTFIQITEGLKAGDEVIVAPYRAVSKTLKNNDDVEKVEKKDLFKKTDE
ncbi:MAG: efflux RND transporter periplasmic adaptor subunit, partial [Bacteroidetes bacterium]